MDKTFGVYTLKVFNINANKGVVIVKNVDRGEIELKIALCSF